jgi:hypothetical protein
MASARAPHGRERMIFAAVGWVITLAAFVLARWSAFALFSRYYWGPVRWEPLIAADSSRIAGISRTDIRCKSPARRDALLDRISAHSRVASGDAALDCDHQNIPGRTAIPAISIRSRWVTRYSGVLCSFRLRCALGARAGQRLLLDGTTPCAQTTAPLRGSKSSAPIREKSIRNAG